MNYPLILKEIDRIYKERHLKFGEIISFQYISQKIQERLCLSNEEIKMFWERLYNDHETKYKYTFVTLPKWSGSYDYFKIGGQLFSHFIIEFE